MKVLHFVNTNGNHGLLIDLAKQMQASGTSVVLGCMEGPGPMHETAARNGWESIALGISSRREYPGAIVKLARMLRRMRVDVVHTHLTDPTLIGLTAARLAGVRGRVVTRHHSDERVIYKSRAGVLLDRFIGRVLARHTVAISGAVERALTEIDKLPASRIRKVANGYEWHRVQSSPEAAQAVRRELGVPDGDLVLGLVGRIAWAEPEKGWMKGQERLIKAFAAANIAASSHLVFVGAGDSSELEQLARRLGVAERCHFLGFRKDCFDVMAACDVIVHPSVSEAQSQVIIEAMALGRPVIASDVGAAPDSVLPGKTGWLVPARDDVGLSAALRDAASNRARLSAYGLAGQKLVHELYPIENMARGYQAIYAEQVA